MKKILVIAILIILLIAAFFVSRARPSNAMTKEEAIRQAQEYQHDGVCTMALVPAVHKATGAKYTFSSGCLAPGWEPER